MIERTLPRSVVAAELFSDDPAATLPPQRGATTGSAMEGTRREFAAVRACARTALARVGLPPAAVRPGPGGVWRWPAGVAGSITHCDGYRAAAVARSRDVLSLGIDAEPNEPLPDEGVLGLVASDTERARLDDLASGIPGICWDRLLLCAKESVCKAWFPLAMRRLRFESADVVIDSVYGTFGVRLLVPGPEVGGAPLTWMDGRWAASQGLLLTAIVIPACPGLAIPHGRDRPGDRSR